MALPIVGTLLSLGVSLVDKLVDTSDSDKQSLKEKFLCLDKEGRTEELEAEVKKLQYLTSIDQAQASLAEKSIDSGSKSRDFNLYVLGAGIATNFIGVPVLNYITGIINALMYSTPIPTMQFMDVEQLIALLGGTLGLGGLSYIKKSNRA